MRVGLVLLVMQAQAGAQSLYVPLGERAVEVTTSR